MPTVIPPRRHRCLEVPRSQRQVLVHLEVGVLQLLEEAEGVHSDQLPTMRALRLGVGYLEPITHRTVRLAIQLQGVYLGVNPLLQVLVVQVSQTHYFIFIMSSCPFSPLANNNGTYDSVAPVTTGTSGTAFSAFSEKDSANTNITLQYQSITAMPAYRGSSYEVRL